MYRKMLFLCLAMPAITLFFGVLLSSCHWNDDEFICGITFSASGVKNKDTVLLGTPVTFRVGTTAKTICAAPVFSNPFVSSAYAFKTCINWQNNMLPTSFRLTFDRSIVLEGDTVAAGADLLSQPVFKQYASFKAQASQCASQDYDLVINDTLMQKMVFQQGVHKAHFECNTSDNKRYESQLYVVFKQ